MKKLSKEEAYTLSKEELLNRIGTEPGGLTLQVAEARREQLGFNELTAEKKKSIWLIFLEQFRDFLVIILIAAAAVSALLGDWESSVVILAVITMNAVLGTVQTQKAEQSLDSLKRLSAPSAKVMRGGVLRVIPSRDVTVGDIVCLEAGDYVCADGRILENASLKINESALTGESVSADKEDCELKGRPALGDQKNMVFSGSFVTYGRGRFLVTGIGMETEVGKIASLLNSTKEKKTPLQTSLDRFGQNLSVIILAICASLFAVNIFRGQPVMDSFLFAVALAVAAIPEALSSIVTIVLSFGTQKMAREHAIIRKLQAVEGLGSVSVICSDKTGTLTQNRMTVKSCYTDGTLQPVSEKLKTVDTQTQDTSLKLLLRCGVLCSDASDEGGESVGDPTELALIKAAEMFGLIPSEIRGQYPRLAEIPFDSDRKLMTTVHEMGGRLTMVTKGAVDVLLGRMELSDQEKDRIIKVNQEYSEQGLRVLAFAQKEVTDTQISREDENHLHFIGLMAMMDPPREESRLAVEECIRAGIRPVMITGDHKVTASAIARQIGILRDGERAVEGSDIENLTDSQLVNMVDQVSVYARVSPEHKIRIVRAWQEKGCIVAMTGDGVNDAPALKQADIGVAMGITGTEAAKDAASMVLADDNFATIVKAVENGRNVYENIRKAIQFLLSGNTAGILAVLYAAVAGLPVPFAAVHLLFINLLTDSLPAIALGLEPHSGSVMEKAPRAAKESILNGFILTRIAVEGLVIGITTMAAFYIGLEAGGAKMASTMAFATLCLSRLIHGFNCKEEAPVLFTKRFFGNRYLLGAFGIGFVLLHAVLLIPGLSGIFSVTPLSLKLIGCIYGLSLTNLLVIQLLKALRHWFKRIFPAGHKDSAHAEKSAAL